MRAYFFALELVEGPNAEEYNRQRTRTSSQPLQAAGAEKVKRLDIAPAFALSEHSAVRNAALPCAISGREHG